MKGDVIVDDFGLTAMLKDLREVEDGVAFVREAIEDPLRRLIALRPQFQAGVDKTNKLIKALEAMLRELENAVASERTNKEKVQVEGERVVRGRKTPGKTHSLLLRVFADPCNKPKNIEELVGKAKELSSTLSSPVKTVNEITIRRALTTLRNELRKETAARGSSFIPEPNVSEVERCFGSLKKAVSFITEILQPSPTITNDHLAVTSLEIDASEK